MIKFITEENKALEPKFKDVLQNQFFISTAGGLCMKYSSNRYSRIATGEGEPNLGHYDGFDDMVITKILPKVTKIEF